MIRIAVCDDEKDTALAVSTIVEEELKSSEISYIIDRFQDGQELLAAQMLMSSEKPSTIIKRKTVHLRN